MAIKHHLVDSISTVNWKELLLYSDTRGSTGPIAVTEVLATYSSCRDTYRIADDGFSFPQE